MIVSREIFATGRSHPLVNLLAEGSVPVARSGVIGRGIGASTTPLAHINGGVPCSPMNSQNRLPFETMSKRRRGYPSETHVKRGVRIVHGDKWLEEKLGRNDLLVRISIRDMN